MNILFITPYLPYPPISGGRLQTFLRIKKLKERGHNVYLAAIAEFGAKEKDIRELRKYIKEMEVVPAQIDLAKLKFLLGKSLILELFSFQPGFEAAIKSFIKDKEIDVAVYEGIGSAQYREATRNIPSIIYEHNVEYEIIEQLVSSLKKSFSKIFQGNIDEKLRNLWLYIFSEKEKKLAKEFELNSLRKFDLFITCSDRDASILKKDVKDTPHVTVPWCIEVPNRYHKPEKKDIYNLVFVGSMYWEPNRDAILWFAKEIFPLIQKKIGNIRLLIVGSYPSKEIQALNNNKDIVVKGFIEDISKVWLETDIFVAPIRLGSGVNVKVIEAMSYGIPVVTTAKGAEGLNAVHGEHFLIANTPGEFLDSIQYLIENIEVRESLGLKSREHVLKYHEIDKVMDLFEKVLTNVIRKWQQQHS